MSPQADDVTYVEVECPWCHQPHTVEITDEHLLDEEQTFPPTCGYETENGPCQRKVDDPTRRCWQHENDNE